MVEISDKEYEKLRQTNEKFFSLIEHIPGMIYRGKPDWSIEMVGRGVEKLAGYSIEDFEKGKINWLNLIHPDDKNRVLQEASRLAEKSASIEQEYRIKNKNGEILWVKDKKTSIYFEGKMSYVDGVVLDISKQKEMETKLSEYQDSLEAQIKERTAELTEKRDNYRLIFESVKDILVRVDRGGRILDINQQASKIVGYDKHELIGKRIYSLAAIFVPKSLALVIANFAKRMLGFPISPYEVEAKTADGKQIFFELDAVPLKAPEGSIIGELAILHDVTEQKQATAKLRESEARFRSVVGSASIGLLSLAANGDITFAEGLGIGVLKIKKGEIVGRSVNGIFAQAPGFLAGFSRAIAGENQSAVIELEELVFECRFSPLYDQNKKIIGTTVVMAEITERQRAEESMRATHRFLEIANKEMQRDHLLNNFVTELRGLTGCNAVGIGLLNEQNQLSCHSSQGFGSEYCELETARISKFGDEMDCRILYGKVDPDNPYCTGNGSFYLNNVSSFLKTATAEQRKWGCDLYQKYGYQSMAFIPIRLGVRILGMIQLADQGENKTPLKMIMILEDVAKQLALAIKCY